MMEGSMMSDHLAIADIAGFIERHGYALLFFWVLAEQGALPLPSIPLLVTAGALVRLGRLRLSVRLTSQLLLALPIAAVVAIAPWGGGTTPVLAIALAAGWMAIWWRELRSAWQY